MTGYQPKTGHPCHCKRSVQRDNCPDCEGTGQRIDFAAIRARRLADECHAYDLDGNRLVSDEIVRRAIDAMFVPVVEAFPDIKTGDFSPDQEIALQSAVRAAIAAWVENNS